MYGTILEIIVTRLPPVVRRRWIAVRLEPCGLPIKPECSENETGCKLFQDVFLLSYFVPLQSR